MAQIIKTISVSKKEDEFISLNNISPTRLLRNKIQEMMEFQKNQQPNQDLLQKIDRLIRELEGYSNFLYKKGLLDEFLEQKD